jgi:hypothetical protein
MAQPASYFNFPSSQPAPAPSSSPSDQSFAPAPTPAPIEAKPAVTSDAYCLYTTQGQIVCSRKADNVAIAPWGSEN